MKRARFKVGQRVWHRSTTKRYRGIWKLVSIDDDTPISFCQLVRKEQGLLTLVRQLRPLKRGER